MKPLYVVRSLGFLFERRLRSLPFKSVSIKGVKVVKTDIVVPRWEPFHTVRVQFKVRFLDGRVEHDGKALDPVSPTSTTSGDENLPNRI